MTTHLEKTLRHLARGRPLVEQLEASVLLVKSEGREQYRKRKWEQRQQPKRNR